MIDSPALLIAMCCTMVVQGLLLLFFWIQDRGARSLGLWGLSFLMSSAGLALIGWGEASSHVWSSGAGGAMLLGAGGMMWAAVRVFQRRSVSPLLVAAPAVLWLFFCFVASPGQVVALQSVVVAFVVGLVCFASAFELWRDRAERLVSRAPLVVLLALLGMVFLVRSVTGDAGAAEVMGAGTGDMWHAMLSFLVFVLTSMLAFFVVGLKKERIEEQHRQLATIDPATGALRRGAFMMQGARLLARRSAERGSSCLVLFELSSPQGATPVEALHRFADAAAGALKPTDLIARMSSSAFACIIGNMTIGEAVDTAEQLIRRFEASGGKGAGDDVMARAGVAGATQVGGDLRFLLDAADVALSNARFSGRRVMHHHPSLERLDVAGGDGVRRHRLTHGRFDPG